MIFTSFIGTLHHVLKFPEHNNNNLASHSSLSVTLDHPQFPQLIDIEHSQRKLALDPDCSISNHNNNHKLSSYTRDY